ncbi:MAG: sigma-54 dependent transcriptional regulator [Desulfuromonadales bacterium]
MTTQRAASAGILLVDDEEQILFSSKLLLKSNGFDKIICLSEGARVLPLLEYENISLIVLDLCMPGIPGLELLKKVNYTYPDIPVIVMTAVYEIDTAVECIKSGAFDYLTKPVRTADFLARVRLALQMVSLQRENSTLKRQLLANSLECEESFAGIRTANHRMRSIFHYVEAVAGGAATVLITGETGVGKELIAGAIHNLSGRRGNLVSVNSAGLDDNIFSDTLFGHKKGAFTNADTEREGLISRAGGGTLFLDEIGDLDARSQIRLLRLLQEREYYQLGSDIPKRTDARIIVATNRDIDRMVALDAFRKDLYFRLSPHHIRIPPLRERLDDLPLLVDHFLDEFAAATGAKRPAYPRELILLLSTYDFPGNVRELQGMISDALVRHKGGMLSLDCFSSYLDQRRASCSPLPAFCSAKGIPAFPPFPDRLPTFREAEEYLVNEALLQAGNNQGIAAKILGITRQALNKRLNKTSAQKR